MKTKIIGDSKKYKGRLFIELCWDDVTLNWVMDNTQTPPKLWVEWEEEKIKESFSVEDIINILMEMDVSTELTVKENKANSVSLKLYLDKGSVQIGTKNPFFTTTIDKLVVSIWQNWEKEKEALVTE